MFEPHGFTQDHKNLLVYDTVEDIWEYVELNDEILDLVRAEVINGLEVFEGSENWYTWSGTKSYLSIISDIRLVELISKIEEILMDKQMQVQAKLSGQDSDMSKLAKEKLGEGLGEGYTVEKSMYRDRGSRNVLNLRIIEKERQIRYRFEFRWTFDTFGLKSASADSLKLCMEAIQRTIALKDIGAFMGYQPRTQFVSPFDEKITLQQIISTLVQVMGQFDNITDLGIMVDNNSGEVEEKDSSLPFNSFKMPSIQAGYILKNKEYWFAREDSSVGLLTYHVQDCEMKAEGREGFEYISLGDKEQFMQDFDLKKNQNISRGKCYSF